MTGEQRAYQKTLIIKQHWQTIKNLRAEADQRQHQLQQELDRNRALQARVNELETTLALYRKRLGINEPS